MVDWDAYLLAESGGGLMLLPNSSKPCDGWMSSLRFNN